jgi:hypothetical protein
MAAHASRRRRVAGAVLNDTAAIRRSGKNFVARTEPSQDLEAQQRDMRSLQNVAAEIHDDVRRRFGVVRRLACEAGEQIGRKLQPREHLHRRGHFLKSGLTGGAPFVCLPPLV